MDTRPDVLSACVTAHCARDMLMAVHVTTVEAGVERSDVMLFNGARPVVDLVAALAIPCGGRGEKDTVMRRARVFAGKGTLPLCTDEPWASIRTVRNEAVRGALRGAYTASVSSERVLSWYRSVSQHAAVPLCTRNSAAAAASRRAGDAFATGVRWIVENQRIAAINGTVMPCTSLTNTTCSCLLDSCFARALGGRLELRVVLAPSQSETQAFLAAAATAAASVEIAPRTFYTFCAPDADAAPEDDDTSSSTSSASRSGVGGAAHARHVLVTGVGETCFEQALARFAPNGHALYELCIAADVDEFHGECLHAMLKDEGRTRLCERVLRYSRALLKVLGGDRGMRALAAHTAGDAPALVRYGMAALEYARPSPLTRPALVVSGYHVAALLALAHLVVGGAPRLVNTWADHCHFTSFQTPRSSTQSPPLPALETPARTCRTARAQ